MKPGHSYNRPLIKYRVLDKKFLDIRMIGTVTTVITTTFTVVVMVIDDGR